MDDFKVLFLHIAVIWGCTRQRIAPNPCSRGDVLFLRTYGRILFRCVAFSCPPSIVRRTDCLLRTLVTVCGPSHFGAILSVCGKWHTNNCWPTCNGVGGVRLLLHEHIRCAALERFAFVGVVVSLVCCRRALLVVLAGVRVSIALSISVKGLRLNWTSKGDTPVAACVMLHGFHHSLECDWCVV